MAGAHWLRSEQRLPDELGLALTALGEHSTWVVHLWSLAEEEQFYLLWPLILGIALRGRVNLRLLLGVLLVAALGGELWAAADASSNFYHYSPISRSTPIVAGCLLAVVQLRFRGGMWLGLAMFSAAVVFIQGSTIEVAALWRPMAIIGSMLLVANAGWPFTWRPLVGLGLISYSLYLWHPLYLHLLPHDTVLAVALAVLTAVASWRWIERPFRRRRPRAVQGNAGQSSSPRSPLEPLTDVRV